MIELSPNVINLVLIPLFGALAVYIRSLATEKRQFIEMVTEQRAELAALKKNYEAEVQRNDRLEDRLRRAERELSEVRSELTEVMRERDGLRTRLRDIEKAQSTQEMNTTKE